MRQIIRGVRLRAIALALSGAASMMACSVTDSLLETTDPDIINPDNVQSVEGAEALRIGALSRLRTISGGSGGEGSTWLFGGLLADEWSTSSTFIQNDETDQRKIKEDNSTVETMFYNLNRARTAANQAMAALRKFKPTPQSDIAEMYFVRGFAEMQIAQDFCSPVPIGEGAGEDPILRQPLTRTEILNMALASLDTAMTLSAGATDTSGITIHRAARVARARAFVNLNKLPEAAALVPNGTSGAGVIPTNFAYNNTYSLTGGTNVLWAQPASSRRYTVGDSLEGNARNLLVKNAIPFFSAQDPRLPVRYTTQNSGKDTVKSQDGFTFSRTTTLYGQLTPAAVVNGIDARLIQAEERLQAPDYPGMMAILNALRDTARTIGAITTPRMAALPVPTTPDEARDLFFREKAFWTFTRGQRLGDMRRLMKYYNRTQDQVFPVGEHYRGGEYGTDIALPVPTAERDNENYRNFVRPVGDACNNG